MRMCLKCSKRVSDDSKICRDCGAILDDVPDDMVSGTGSEPKPAPQRHSPWTAKPWKSRQEERDEPSIGTPTAEPDKQAQADVEPATWKCPQCGELVPGNFDVCWKCATTRDGEKAEGQEPVSIQEEPDDSDTQEELEPSGSFAESFWIDDDAQQTPSQSVCPKCGSAKMILGVTVRDQGQHSSGKLQVVVCGDPSALIFKDRLHGDLKANICGDCGHVELRVANPRALYRHYRKSLK